MPKSSPWKPFASRPRGAPRSEADWAAAQNTYGADVGNASLGSNIYINYPLSCTLMGNYGATEVLIALRDFEPPRDVPDLPGAITDEDWRTQLALARVLRSVGP